MTHATTARRRRRGAAAAHGIWLAIYAVTILAVIVGVLQVRDDDAARDGHARGPGRVASLARGRTQSDQPADRCGGGRRRPSSPRPWC